MLCPSFSSRQAIHRQRRTGNNPIARTKFAWEPWMARRRTYRMTAYLIHVKPIAERWGMLLVCAVLLTACAAPTSPQREGAAPQEGQSRATGRTKTLTVGITSTVQAFSIAGGTTTTGGWQSLNEIHTSALVTSDAQSRTPVARLAE